MGWDDCTMVPPPRDSSPCLLGFNSRSHILTQGIEAWGTRFYKYHIRRRIHRDRACSIDRKSRMLEGGYCDGTGCTAGCSCIGIKCY